MVEDEQKARDDARESQAKSERNANKLSAELEEVRAQLEQVSLISAYVVLMRKSRKGHTVLTRAFPENFAVPLCVAAGVRLIFFF